MGVNSLGWEVLGLILGKVIQDGSYLGFMIEKLEKNLGFWR